jgi:pentatricopeptide repeat protein
VQAYVIMTHAYAKSGDIEKALSLLDEMEHFKLLPTVYNYNAVLLAAAKAPLW